VVTVRAGVGVKVRVRVDLDLQSQESYGHTCKRSRSVGSKDRVKTDKRTDGRTINGRRQLLISHASTVVGKNRT